MIEKQANYETLLEKIGITYREAKSSAVLAINKALLTAY
jgi:hypothetical protein